MIEAEGDLFTPPRTLEVGAICIPVSCELVSKAAVMKQGYALQAKARYKGIDKAIGYFSALVGHRAHLLTFLHRAENGEVDGIAVHGGGGQLVPFHIFSFPTRKKWDEPPSLDFVVKSARELEHLLEKKEEIKGKILIPRLGQQDASGALGWESLRKHMDIWLPSDRYVIISGNKGTPS